MRSGCSRRSSPTRCVRALASPEACAHCMRLRRHCSPGRSQPTGCDAFRSPLRIRCAPAQMRKRKELEEERMQLAMAVERHRSQIEQKERAADDIRCAGFFAPAGVCCVP
eukprot:5133929-Prymnesium_polylepis.1